MPILTSCISSKVLTQAALWKGTPYHPHLAQRQQGCHCLGLLQGLWEEVYGIPLTIPPLPPEIPPLTAFQISLPHFFIQRPALSPHPSDILLFALKGNLRWAHVGVWTAGEMLLHAQEHRGVVEELFPFSLKKRLHGVYGWRESPPPPLFLEH